MKICSTCILPETYPGIRFNEAGVCSHCQAHAKRGTARAAEQRQYREKFLRVIEELRPAAHGEYDAIMAYSGGKDSTYTLKLLKETYGLRVLAVTFDNDFISRRAQENIKTVTRTLGTDHLQIYPGSFVLRKAFVRSIDTDVYPPKALERASAICNTCMNLVKSAVLKLAFEKDIPLLSYGWSPGQAPIASSVMKLNEALLRQMQDTMAATTGSLLEISAADREAGRMPRTDFMPSGGLRGRTLYAVHPLAFHEYHEESVVREIERIGWQAPRDTDSNSTNCLLNAFANDVHLRRYGYHPYAFEIAGLVREGCMSREEGISKITAPPPPGAVAEVRKRLGIRGNGEDPERG